MAVRHAWRREAVIILCWLGVSALAGLIAGRLTLCLLLGVIAYLGMQLVYAYQLHRWLVSDRIEPSDGVGIWQEIYTELYRLKQRNRKRKKRLKGILDEFQASTAALPDAAVVMDSHSRILWFNNAAAALLALQRPRDLGQRIANLLRHPDFSRYVAIGGDKSNPVEMPSPANENHTILVRLIPYGDNQRLLIARDISEQKKLESTRRDFAANASHELRTPLTVLRGYLDMMAEETTGQGSLEYWKAPVGEMQAQAQRMSRIIESLLMLARVEAEGLQQPQERVDVPAMLHSLVDDLRATDDGAHRFELDIQAGLDLFGRTSELQSVFSNLLSNALRYTPADGLITVRWRSDDNGARLSVSDNGPGIEPEHIARLTERFYRVDAGRDASSGGTGLGLAIVKHCLEHHESELMIDSVPGQGATFSCHFPPQRSLASG